MEIDLTTKLQDFEDKPMKDNKAELTLGKVLRLAIGSPNKTDDGEKLLKKYKLGLKCVADSAEFSTKEIEMLKDAVAEFYKSPLVFGRVCELLDPPSVEEA